MSDISYYIEKRIKHHLRIIEEQRPKLPDLVAAIKIDIAEHIIEELEDLNDFVS